MPLINLSNAARVYLGATEAERVYVGGNLVWEPASGETWVPVAYVGGTTATSAGAATYDVPLTGLTGGIGSAPQPGDLIVIASGFISQGVAGGQGVVTAGYVVAQSGSADSTRDAHLSVCYKRLTTADTSVTVQGSDVATNASCTVVYVWRGIDPASPMDVPAILATGVGSRNGNSPPITPITAGTIVLSIAGATSGNPTAYTAPSGYGNILTAIHDPGLAYQLGIGSKVWSGAGEEDPLPWTGGASAADSWVAVTLALRPMTPPVV